ncbi:MAG: acireductone synthase [Vampirovibrionales bacterium]|nr:acireductone synthase [Vampirovibrionales bacterium]
MCADTLKSNIMIRFILLDIEGTTTDINFVHKVLFPYSQQHLKPFLQENRDSQAVADCLQQVQTTVVEEEGKEINVDEAIAYLMHWIVSDRKHGALKTIQGMIWEQGFKDGTFKGHVYPDVPESLEQWKQLSLRTGIYSSGSIHSQKLLFSHTEYGDLTRYFSAHFDTSVGGKKEVASYQSIAKHLEFSPSEILFISDAPEELLAAEEAGFNVLQSIRPGIKADNRFEQIRDLFGATTHRNLATLTT